MNNLWYVGREDYVFSGYDLHEVSITANPVEMGVINAQDKSVPLAYGLVGFAGGAAAASYGLITFSMAKDFAIDYSLQNVANLVTGQEKNVDVFDASLSMIPDNKYTMIPKVIAGAFINIKENGSMKKYN
ncbi:hypothetical protein [Flammeovirga pacifica]|uniref:Uncharacterized protein n=1 Tax=Flammeovirga pacifica TaxID=915059 RepID=A0A1S1YXR9_FLAPC|nr:hypothetical protein [Flammeovirga pacifica]OHX65798.1 hypothetical protein NH26_05255 [Flammeovirga pacifica]